MPYSPEQIVETESFRDFLVKAKQNGYGSEAPRMSTTASGMHVIDFVDGNFSYQDNFVGGNPFAGFEHVSYHDEERLWTPAKMDYFVPIWGMSYYETDFEEGINLTAAHLREILGRVLQNPDKELPVRGPLGLDIDLRGSGRVKYTFEPERGSKLGNFSAEETIRLDGRRVYVAKFIGGVIG